MGKELKTQNVEYQKSYTVLYWTENLMGDVAETLQTLQTEPTQARHIISNTILYYVQ